MTEALTKPTPDPTILTTEQLLREVKNLEDKIMPLVNAQFAAISDKFVVLEAQRIEQKADNRIEVGAALTAQKEENDKSERLTSERLAQLATQFDTAISGMSTQLNDLKDRVTRFESLKLGGTEVTQDRRASTALVVSLIGMGIVLTSALVGVILFVVTKQPSTVP
jgi:hypothetical protein